MKSMNRRKWVCVAFIAVLILVTNIEYTGVGVVFAAVPISTTVQAHTVQTKHGESTIQVKPSVGYVAPTVVLQDLQGKEIEIGGQREKPMLLNFWASWCAPCHQEAAEFKKLSKKWEGKLDVVGLNATKFDRVKDVKLFVETHAITYPILLDPKGKAIEAYRIYGFPTSFLIDEQGIVQEILWGALPFNTLDEKVKLLING